MSSYVGLRPIIAALALTVLVPGCNKANDTYLVVTVTKGAATSVVDKIDLTLDLGTEQATRTLDKGGAEVELPTTAVFQIRNGSGSIWVSAQASHQGAAVIGGRALGEIRRGANNQVTVELGKFESADGGAGGAGGAGGQGGAGGGGGAAKANSDSRTVNAGNYVKSANYRAVFTLGQPSVGQSVSKSSNFRLNGGLTGANGSK